MRTWLQKFWIVDYRSLNILSLCAGVGGLDLGIRVAQPNARAVCFVEIKPLRAKIHGMEGKTMDKRLFGRITIL